MKIFDRVHTPMGDGTITAINYFTNKADVSFDVHIDESGEPRRFTEDALYKTFDNYLTPYLMRTFDMDQLTPLN